MKKLEIKYSELKTIIKEINSLLNLESQLKIGNIYGRINIYIEYPDGTRRILIEGMSKREAILVLKALREFIYNFILTKP